MNRKKTTQPSESEVEWCGRETEHEAHMYQRGGKVETKADWRRVAIPVKCPGSEDPYQHLDEKATIELDDRNMAAKYKGA